MSKSYDEYYEDAKHKILGNGTHVIMDGSLSPVKLLWLDPRFGDEVAKAYPEDEIETGYGTWYRSKERIDGKYPFAGPITRKNWYGTEVSMGVYFATKFHYFPGT